MSFKYNPFTGNLDIVKNDNFSYDNIIENYVLCVPVNQQMIVHGRLTNDGTIINDGTLVVI